MVGPPLYQSQGEFYGQGGLYPFAMGNTITTPPTSSFHIGGDFVHIVNAVFKPKYHIISHLGDIIIVAEKYGGVHPLLFCVLFQFHMGRIRLQGLRILGEVVGLLSE